MVPDGYRKEVNQMKSKMTKLERLRRDAGLTQEELSKKSGVSRGVIVRIESGNIGTVLGKNIFLLAKSLCVEPGDLF